MSEREPEPQTPAGESRLRRGVRYGHRTVLYASLVVVLITGVYLILLIARNTDKAKLDYVFGTANTRLIWLIVISAIVGWALGIATGALFRRRTRRPR